MEPKDVPKYPKLAETLSRLSGYKSAREIADLADISNTYVSRILKGHRPTFDVLVKIARGLDLTPDQLAELLTAGEYALQLPSEDARSVGEALWNGVLQVINDFKKAHPEFQEAFRINLDHFDQLPGTYTEGEVEEWLRELQDDLEEKWESGVGREEPWVISLGEPDDEGALIRFGGVKAGVFSKIGTDATDRILESTAAHVAGRPAPTADPEEQLLERLDTPRDHYHQRLGELLDLCAELEVEPMLADFYGGEQGQVQTHEDADRVADALVRDQIRSYPEHAERFRALLRGEG